MPVVRRKQKDLFSFIATALFTISIVLAGGSFLYKIFLNYSITEMKGELEAARAALDPGTVDELIRLNARIVSTESLIKDHKMLSPLFNFLESATPKTVRYTNFNFDTTNKGLELMLQGQARGYASLAAAADTFNRAETYFANPAFSDLRLDEKGNVIFTLRVEIQPAILSYHRYADLTVQRNQANQAGATATTTTATSTTSSTPPR